MCVSVHEGDDIRFFKSHPQRSLGGNFFFPFPFVCLWSSVPEPSVSPTQRTHWISSQFPAGSIHITLPRTADQPKSLFNPPGVDKASEFESEDVIPCRGLEPWFL